MSLLSMIESIIIGPLKLIFEIIFACSYRILGKYDGAIVCLSLIVNLLVLPLYRRADAMQEQARDIDAALHDGVAHIKKTFSGDERMMILQTYYRQCHYKPTDALKGSVSLLLEVPFFIAAYQFLSGLSILNEVSFGPIRSFGAPDGLLVIGGMTINVLPVLMTLINFLSSAVYLQGFPAKTKIQVYGMALVFLVLLYSSPSGLVFYWTLNNLFSLVKNILCKYKPPRKLCYALSAVAGAALCVYGIWFYHGHTMKVRLLWIFIGLALALCPVIQVWMGKRRDKALQPAKHRSSDRKLFLAGCAALTVFMGLLIPSTFIAASPQEYVDIQSYYSPLWYIVSSLCLAAGTFLVWLQVFYWLAGDEAKVYFDRFIVIAVGAAFVNYMFFGLDLGIISADLKYDNGIQFTAAQMLLNLLVLAVVGIALFFAAAKYRRFTATVLVLASVTQFGMSAVNVVSSQKSLSALSRDYTEQTELPYFNLSKTGKNVVVILLDRFMGGYFPYILNEKPELAEQLAGFTYYPNTLSFGQYTVFATPALYGGYEYTPVEMNKRDSEPMVDKHNEALKVLPALFQSNGYQVTMCDSPYANYQWIPDLSIFDDLPGVNTYITEGTFSTQESRQTAIDARLRNFFCFSVMKSMPLAIQKTIYNDGQYNHFTNESLQTFLRSFEVLRNLSTMTKVIPEESNTFLFLYNATPHNLVLLQAPEYLPVDNVDNSAYDRQNTDRFINGSDRLVIRTDEDMAQYHDDIAALIQIGQWLDDLREKGVYDNTRIILVSDHGSDCFMLEDQQSVLVQHSRFFPLLLVKDFDSEDFQVSDEFMTVADIPTLAVDRLIESPVNPYTGKAITSSEKQAHPQLVSLSYKIYTDAVSDTTFVSSEWASVQGNALDLDCWETSKTKTVLKEHTLP